MFIPKHYPQEVWRSYAERGYRLNRFLARPANVIDQMSAVEFLRTGWDEMFKSGDERGVGCCLASIILPQRAGVIRLNCDEDYFFISLQNNNQVTGLARWQFAKRLEGFRLDELWMNMIEAKDTPLTAVPKDEVSKLVVQRKAPAPI